MEENKGILEKIKEFFNKIFKINQVKQLPPAQDSNNKEIQENQNSNETVEFKESLKLENYEDKEIIENNDLNEKEEIQTINYNDILNDYMKYGKIDFSSLNEEQIKTLKIMYDDLINSAKTNTIFNKEEFTYVTSYVEKLSRENEENKKYSQFVEKYYKIETQLNNYNINDETTKIDLIKQKNQLKTILLNKFIGNIDKKNPFDIIKRTEPEKEL